MTNSDVRNIILVGVGGQGTILAGKILSSALIDAGYDVKMSEVHGMAQRGGTVSNQVRFGKEVYSPIIAKGQADILVSFELMEAMRWMEYLNTTTGKAVVNDYRIPSAPILAGKVSYPENIKETISGMADTTFLKAADIAAEIGNIKTMNIVLSGALAQRMGLTEIDWEKAIRDNIKPALAEINIKAFRAGAERDF